MDSNIQHRMSILLHEINRQNKDGVCPTCGQDPGHTGWLVCVETRVKEQAQKLEESNG